MQLSKNQNIVSLMKNLKKQLTSLDYHKITSPFLLFSINFYILQLCLCQKLVLLRKQKFNKSKILASVFYILFIIFVLRGINQLQINLEFQLQKFSEFSLRFAQYLTKSSTNNSFYNKKYNQHNQQLYQLFSPSQYSQFQISFSQFKIKFHKFYHSKQEDLFRSIIYRENLQKINKHNKNVNRTYNMALNQFADLNTIQFGQKYTNSFKSNSYIKQISGQLNKKEDIINSKQLIYVQKYLSNYLKQKNKTFLKEQTSNNNLIYSILQQYQLKQKISRTRYQGVKGSLKAVLYSSLNYSQSQNLTDEQIRLFIEKLNSNNNLTTPLTQININKPLSISNVIPDSNITIDWTHHAGRTRQQGICGACYTFATSDAVASLYSIYKYGFFVPLSTQQVVDCANNGLTYGCNGGFLEGSLKYIQIQGIQPEYNYPYSSNDTGLASKCKKNGGPFKITSFKNIPEGNCNEVVNQLKYGPLSVAIAGYRLQFYSSGVFNDCGTFIDHAAVLVGYKVGVGWKVKNSWGLSWGMNGFAWLSENNNCGLCTMAVSIKI